LNIQQEVAHHREKAEAHYRKISEFLQAKSSLGTDERNLEMYASLSVAEMLYWMGEYARSGAHYEALAARYKGRVEHYLALAGVVRAYSVPDSPDPTKARKALGAIKAGLGEIDPAVRPGYEEWIRMIEKPVAQGPRP